MPTAAVPAYLGRDFGASSPGLRFGMFLELWGVNHKTGALLWKTHDVTYRRTGRSNNQRRFEDENKTRAVNEASSLTTDDTATMEALDARQQCLVDGLPELERITVSAIAIAPFTTGLGNEHPLENGFAFLNPYGLPYLPGSGVKGVLRRAAEELASGEWGDKCGWSKEPEYSLDLKSKGSLRLSVIDVLFGKEPPSGDQDQVRAALSFLDVIPQIKGDRLAVEIMTPHQSHYYQIGEPPHDSGSPNPISFLTIPSGSAFNFHVICDRRRLSRPGTALAESERWKELLLAAFAHAFEWLGFGAKTAVGYGAMQRDEARESQLQREREERERKEREAREREERLVAMDPIDRQIQRLLDQRIDKNLAEVTAIIQAVQMGHWQGKDKIDVAKRLEDRMKKANQWKESSAKKNPAKDKPFQKTQLVKRWQEGE